MSIDVRSTPDIGARTAEVNKGNAEARLSGRARAVSAESLPADDTVTLTPTAATLAGLMEAVAAAPELDTERVERVKAALASGEYVVDADQVARKLIMFEGSL
jgi:negative regulator of flagellin synthesis FlgM